jgi:hypothetical protein
LFVLLVFLAPASEKLRMSPSIGATPPDQLAAVDQLPLVAEAPVQVRTVAADPGSARSHRLKTTANSAPQIRRAAGHGKLREWPVAFFIGLALDG